MNTLLHSAPFSQIISAGAFVPPTRVTNQDLEKKLNTTDAWIREHIGIVERRFVTTESTADLAVKAAQAALERIQMPALDIDAIVCATSTPDHPAPGIGVFVQHALGCRTVPAFDIHNTSPGFVFALDAASGLIASGRYKTILVIASEVHSRILDMTPRGRLMSVIFGDGAGAVIVKHSEKPGIRSIRLHSRGQDAAKLWWPQSNDPLSENAFPQMDGRFVFEHAVTCMTNVIQETLGSAGIETKDVDSWLFHQANKRIIEHIGTNLKLDPALVPTNIEHYGNTSAASIPLLLAELWDTGKIKTGQTCMMTSFGSGLSWGSVLATL